MNPRWIAVNVDTGGGGTVWPMNAACACQKISGPGGRGFFWIFFFGKFFFFFLFFFWSFFFGGFFFGGAFF